VRSHAYAAPLNRRYCHSSDRDCLPLRTPYRTGGHRFIGEVCHPNRPVIARCDDGSVDGIGQVIPEETETRPFRASMLVQSGGSTLVSPGVPGSVGTWYWFVVMPPSCCSSHPIGPSRLLKSSL